MHVKRNVWRKKVAAGRAFFTATFAFILIALCCPVSTPLAQTNASPSDIPGSFSGLVTKASPSVVNINVVKVVKGTEQAPSPFGPQDPFKDFFDRFLGEQMPREYKQQGLGTGFIIDKEGFILTNNHVIEDASEINIRLTDGLELPGKVVGTDPKTDLALIKIDPKSTLMPLVLGDSDKLNVGDWVVAIGNPFGLGNTVTAGIVSAKYRQLGTGNYDNFIQTDASINPGNSGGPLLNVMGEVIGINSAIFSQSGGSIGIGFAIPINMAKDLLPQLKKGKVIRGWIGVMIQSITPDLKEKLGLENQAGALIADITPGGPADKAGIMRGDVIVSFDGHDVKSPSDLPLMVASTPIGKIVDIDVIRKGERKSTKLEIAELKEEEQETQQAGASELLFDLGMQVEQLIPEIARYFGLTEIKGVVVVEVTENSPAAEAGLQPADIILEIDHTQVGNIEQYIQLINSYNPGDTILLLIKRQGATHFLSLKVGR